MIIFLLGVCFYQESIKEVSEEIVLLIFIFSLLKNNVVIDEKEMKESIKIYLNINEDLFNISD